MTLEKLGIAQEAQDRRERYARFAYRAPIPAGFGKPKPKDEPAKPIEVAIPKLSNPTGGDIRIADLHHQLAARDRYIVQLEEQLGIQAAPVPIVEVQRAFLALLAEAGYFLNGKPVELHQLQNPSRHRSIAWPRHVCMDAVRRICRASYPMIGKHFGNRDHSTAIHAEERTPHHLAAVPVLGEIHAKLLARWAVR